VLMGAILIVGPNASNSDKPFSDTHERLGGNPITCVELLGKSILQRTISRLEHYGLNDISIVADGNLSSLISSQLPRKVQADFVREPMDVWTAAQKKFGDLKEKGSEVVVLIRMGAYVEFNLKQLLEFHRDKQQSITPMHDSHGPVDIWLLSASNTPRTIIPDRVEGSKVPSPMVPFLSQSYVNRLTGARDLRRLVVDAFFARCEIRPMGLQVKTGVWVDEGAQIHRRARLVAPAYIGQDVKVQSDAVITRCTNLERGSEVGYGTVVEDTSVLTGTCLGTGLDLAHAVVCGNNLIHLRRDVALQISDPQLLSGRSFVCPPPAYASEPKEPAVLTPIVDINGVRGTSHDRQPSLILSKLNAWAG